MGRPDALMYILAFLLWMYVWRIQDVFPVLGKVKAGWLALGPALLLFMNSRDRLRRLALLRSRITMLVGLVVVFMALSIPTSLWPGKGIEFLVKDFGPTLVVMGLVAASIRSVEDVLWYLKANAIGAFFFAAFVLLTFSVDASGRLDNLVYYDANDFGLLMVSVLPLAVLFFRLGRGPRLKAYAMLALGTFIFGIVRSGSRGAFIGMLAVTLYLLFRFRAIPARVRVGTVIVGALAMTLLATDKYWEMMGTLLHPKQDYNWAGNAEGGRMEVWRRGISYMFMRPINGVGVRAFPQAEGTLSEEAQDALRRGLPWKWSAAHNSYVEIGAETGVVGFVAFLALFYYSFGMLARFRQRSPALQPTLQSIVAQGLTGALIGFAVAGFFVSAEYFAYLYFYFSLVLGMEKVAARAPAVVTAAQPRVITVQVPGRRGGLARAYAFARGTLPRRTG